MVFTLVTDCCGYGVQFKAFHTKPSHTGFHRIDQTKFTTLTNFHILDLTEFHNFDHGYSVHCQNRFPAWVDIKSKYVNGHSGGGRIL